MTKEITLEDITLDYNTASTRLLLFDYDGCLTPIKQYPYLATPSQRTRQVIDDLSADRKNHIMVISGRPREDLDNFFPDASFILTAEHGAYYKHPGNNWRQLFPVSGDWTDHLSPFIKALTFQYEGSFMEKKTYSISWHYRAIADALTQKEIDQILEALKTLQSLDNFIIEHDKFTIELRTPSIDKGSFIVRWMSTKEYDFTMAIGDGDTDEDMFKPLSSHYTIRVGEYDQTLARYHLEEQKNVIQLLENIRDVNNEFEKITTRIGLQHHS